MIPEYQSMYDELDFKYKKIQRLKDEFKEIQKEYGAATKKKSTTNIVNKSWLDKPHPNTL